MTYNEKVEVARKLGFKMDMDYDKNKFSRHVVKKPIRPWYMMFCNKYDKDDARIVYVSEEYLFKFIISNENANYPTEDLICLINNLRCQAANKLHLLLPEVRLIVR